MGHNALEVTYPELQTRQVLCRNQQLAGAIYLSERFVSLSSLNRRLIEAVCRYLGIDTKISNSWDYSLAEGKTERLAELCRQAGGSEYISGPAAKDYIDERIFQDMDINLSWFDYSGYAEYPQLWGDFIHGVTILDLLFNCGKEAPRFMRVCEPMKLSIVATLYQSARHICTNFTAAPRPPPAVGR